MKMKIKCPQCGRVLELVKEHQLGETKLYEYKCGHLFAKTLHRTSKSDLDLNAVDGSGKKARDYQADGVEFIVNSGYNCIIGDQMRLGKTPQSLLALKNAFTERTPALIIVKSANLWQWIREFKTWTSTLPNGIFPIQGGNAHIFPGFSAYIISMDTFGLNARCKSCAHSYHEKECKKKDCKCRTYVSSENSVRDRLKQIPFRLVIVDEAHSFKNTDSNRSQALVDFMTFLNTGEESTKIQFTCARCQNEWTEEGKVSFDKRIGHKVTSKSSRCAKCGNYVYQQQQRAESESERVNDPCGLILLSGTPILNRAEEYFIPLNLVAPDKFASLDGFRRNWLQQDEKGRWTRVKHYYIEAFKEQIAPYILRREWNDVYSDLPALNKTFTLIEPTRDKYTEQYNKVLDKMEAVYASKADPSFFDMAEDMMALRRICGLMKIPYVVDYLKENAELEAMMGNPKQKWALGIHHESVRDILFTSLGGPTTCFKLSGEDSSDAKDRIMRQFEHSSQNYLIINMLAGGVGMDFHYCNNIAVLERQWNSAMEDQFEARFYNPDKSIKKDPTNVEYIIAKGTIDEWWYDMVEQKRRIFGETVANKWDLERDNATFKDLVARTLQGRL
jgi:SNF2 family DNA or RNA helicase